MGESLVGSPRISTTRLSHLSTRKHKVLPCTPQHQAIDGHKPMAPLRTARKRKSAEERLEKNVAWGRLMEECADLQRDLEGEWEDAAGSIAVRREEYERALTQYEELQNVPPWKMNVKYRQQKQEIRLNLKNMPDPVGDRDKEIVLRVACPTSAAASKSTYVSLADMTPGRLHYLSKAGRRGFGQTPISPETLLSNLAVLRSPHLRPTNSFSSEVAAFQVNTEPASTHQRMDTFSSQQTRSSTSPINEFIIKQISRYVRSPVSRALLARKKTQEAAIEKIQSSPDIARKVERLEKAEKKRRLKFSGAHTFKSLRAPQEEELKQAILEYRMSPKQEIAMDRRVRRSVLMGKGDRRKSGLEMLLGL